MCLWGCYSFNGTGDYIETSADNNLNFGTGDLTYNLWFKSLSTEDSHIIIRSAYSANQSAIGIYLYNGNRLIVVVRRSDGIEIGVSSDTIPGNWYLVTLTRKNQVLYMHLNGVIIGSTTGSTFNCIGNIKTKIGADTASLTNYFNGLIDDVRIYNNTLSISQIKQEYIAGLNSLLANGNISSEEYNERLNSLALNY